MGRRAGARELRARDRAAEAASVRASAGQAVAQLMPAMLAAIEEQAWRAAVRSDRAPGSDSP